VPVRVEHKRMSGMRTNAKRCLFIYFVSIRSGMILTGLDLSEIEYTFLAQENTKSFICQKILTMKFDVQKFIAGVPYQKLLDT